MSSPAVPTQPALSDTVAGPTVADIDASCRWPALFLIAKASFWLVVGSLFLLLASVKLHAPGMMAGKAWLTYGRLLPAGWDLLVYGFAGQAGAAVGLWLLARAAGQRLQAPLLVVAGGAFWNLGVLLGTLGILCGASTGREWLEFPGGAMAFLVIGAGLLGSAGWITFAARTERDVYPSAWFILLALLAFVWCGSVALMMLAGEETRGVVQVLVQRWFAVGVLRLWLGGFLVAILLHYLPLVLDRPLASRQLALVGFWCLAFFAPWAVSAHGDPFPRWLISAGVAGQILSTIGLLALALNWWKTAEGSLAALASHPTGRLVGAATLGYVLVGALQFVTSLQGPSATTRLTWVQAGLDWLLVGSLVVALAVAVPDLLARATGLSLAPGLVSVHGLLTLVGVLLTALPLVLGGFIQGAKLADSSVAFLEALRASMHLVRLSTLGLTAFFLGQLLLLAAVGDLVRRLATEGAQTVAGWAATPGRASVARSKTAGARS